MDIQEGIRLHFVTGSQLGGIIRAAIASDGTQSPQISIEEGGHVCNKVYSANARRKCVSLLTGAFGNNYVFS